MLMIECVRFYKISFIFLSEGWATCCWCFQWAEGWGFYSRGWADTRFRLQTCSPPPTQRSPGVRVAAGEASGLLELQSVSVLC